MQHRYTKTDAIDNKESSRKKETTEKVLCKEKQNLRVLR